MKKSNFRATFRSDFGRVKRKLNGKLKFCVEITKNDMIFIKVKKIADKVREIFYRYILGMILEKIKKNTKFFNSLDE